MNIPETLLGGISPQQFLADYWQKKPLLVRGAYPDFQSPLSAEELLGLACEDDIESRMVLEKDGSKPWELRRGPFTEESFADLPPSHWSTLIQEAHKYIPELALLLEDFRFIPNWRVDDIMASISPIHGSVGPHFDYYDVFLIQGEGRKRWQISTIEPDTSNCLSGVDLRILRDFTPVHDWVLEPGDMLYLPPGVAHHGVAIDEVSITYSVGFRSPTEAEFINGYLEQVMSQLPCNTYYSDPDLTLQDHAGEISLHARERIRGIIRSIALDDASIDRWLGGFVTEAKAGNATEALDEPVSCAEFMSLYQQCQTLWRNEFSRVAYIANADGSAYLYAGGQEYPLTANIAWLAPVITDQRLLLLDDTLSARLADASALSWLTQLYNDGHVYFPEDDGDI